jgi:glycerol uptake facilitator-like aquaporin
LVRASFGSRDFKAGGCWLYLDVIPAREAFVVELVSTTVLLFLAFGLGLDPRQAQVVGPTLAPFLVGLSFGTLAFATSYTRYGYGGPSFNPARCMGVFVGSRFPSWHWIHWYVQFCTIMTNLKLTNLCRAADGIACIIHGICYYFVPPWVKRTD